MKTKVVSLLATGGLLVAIAWILRTPNSVQADDVPEKYRDTVRKGLEYLVAHQCEDGHWEGEGGKHPTATTALAGIALLMDVGYVSSPHGNLPDHTPSKYDENIRKAADWLMSKSRADREGLIFADHPSETDRYMDGHGLATQFLAWACRNERDQVRRKKLHDVVSRAVPYIVKAQSTQGGWYRTSKVEGHDFAQVSTTAIQLQALQIAAAVGVPVDGGIRMDAQAYLKTEIEKQKEDGKPGPNPTRAADLAALLACRAEPTAFLNQDGSNETWFKHHKTAIPMGADVKFGRDEMTHFWYAQAVFNRWLNSKDNRVQVQQYSLIWSEYSTPMFDHLHGTQAKDGSWPAPADRDGGISVGPIHATAVWCTVLQFAKKGHPLTIDPVPLVVTF